MANVQINNLANAVMKELAEYNQEVTDGIKKEIKDAAKFCKKEIGSNSPIRTGVYEDGWTTQTIYENPKDIKIVVHNKEKPGLTHLLENGHVVVGRNGKVLGTAPAFPHITPAESKTEEYLMKKVKVAIKK